MYILLVVYLMILEYTVKMCYKIYIIRWSVFVDILYHIIPTT
jgi:hypothetical protein